MWTPLSSRREDPPLTSSDSPSPWPSCGPAASTSVENLCATRSQSPVCLGGGLAPSQALPVCGWPRKPGRWQGGNLLCSILSDSVLHAEVGAPGGAQWILPDSFTQNLGKEEGQETPSADSTVSEARANLWTLLAGPGAASGAGLVAWQRDRDGAAVGTAGRGLAPRH